MILIAIVDDEKEQVVMLSTCVSVFFSGKKSGIPDFSIFLW